MLTTNNQELTQLKPLRFTYIGDAPNIGAQSVAFVAGALARATLSPEVREGIRLLAEALGCEVEED